MTKRNHELDSEHLVEDLHDEDKSASTDAEFQNERAAIVFAFEEASQSLQTQLAQAPKERHQILEQRLEYEQTLFDDRIAAIDAKIAVHKAETVATVSRKKRRRIVAKDLDDCVDIASNGIRQCSWQSIRKVMHIKYKIEPVKSEMSDELLDKYKQVLIELKEKGFKIANYTKQ
jgi:hypothetical protein|tara:strand:- start:547 stop:1068 length:522 start_codon:yes stop_codon:yes gene_type:complete